MVSALTLAIVLQVQLVHRVQQVQEPQVPQVQQEVPRVLQVPGQAQPREVVAEVLVHGNQIVPDTEVRTLAGIVVGSTFTDALLAEITKRLKDSGKFESIDVVKRFASIEDASRIIIVIIVSEGPVRIVMPGDSGSPAQVQKRSFIRNLMFVPMFEGSDGYGLTVGARIAYPKPFGDGTRLSFPMTWVEASASAWSWTRRSRTGRSAGPRSAPACSSAGIRAFDISDNRFRVWGRAFARWDPFRAGGTAGWQRVWFGGQEDEFTSAGLDVTLDTRKNPALPRNAVLATASTDVLFFDGLPTIIRTRSTRRATLASSASRYWSFTRFVRTPTIRCRPICDPSWAAGGRCAASKPGSRRAIRSCPGRWSIGCRSCRRGESASWA